MDALAVQICTVAALGPGKFGIGRRTGDTQHQLPATQQRDLGRKERALAHERLGAIDRIDQPHTLGVRIVPAGLLAIEAIAGEARPQHGVNRLLGAHIRFGDR